VAGSTGAVLTGSGGEAVCCWAQLPVIHIALENTPRRMAGRRIVIRCDFMSSHPIVLYRAYRLSVAVP